MAQQTTVTEDEVKVKGSLVVKERKSISVLQAMKDRGEKISQCCPVCRDEFWYLAAELAGVDVARTTTSMKGRFDVDFDIEIAPKWIKTVRDTAQNIHLNFVMDTPTYATKERAVVYGSTYQYTGTDSLLPMGVTNEVLKEMADNYIVVFGHTGAISAWQAMATGYKRIGKTCEDALRVYKQAYEYQENGMRAMTIELTPIEVTNLIAKKLRVPVIAIAAGGAADGSEMVDLDTFGLSGGKMPSHCKQYASFFEWAGAAYGQWSYDVKTGAYPEDKHGWHMDPQEYEKFQKAVEAF